MSEKKLFCAYIVLHNYNGCFEDKLLSLIQYHPVPAILSVKDVTVEYNNTLTASFSCNAFGGNNSAINIDLIPPSGSSGLNESSRTVMTNSDGSTTLTISTNKLTLADRGSEYTCDVSYQGAPSEQDNEDFAMLYIGMLFFTLQYILSTPTIT